MFAVSERGENTRWYALHARGAARRFYGEGFSVGISSLRRHLSTTRPDEKRKDEGCRLRDI